MLHAPASNLDEIIAENIPMQDLPQVATNVERDVHKTISVLRDEASQTDGLSLQELSGLDKALQKTREDLVNNLAELSEINDGMLDIQNLIKDAQEQGEEVVELRRQLRDKLVERAASLWGCEWESTNSS